MGSFSGSTSFSKSRSKSKSRSTQDIWGEQSPFLTDLYQRGADLMKNFQPQQFSMGNTMQAYNQQINPQMNPYLDAMTAQYTQALGQLDNATGAGAVQAGVFGGGRQGVEQALNQQNIGNQIGNFLGSQYQSDQARAAAALNLAPQLQGMQFANNPQLQELQALQGYGGLIGGPTVLTQQRAKSRSRSFGFGTSSGGSIASK